MATEEQQQVEHAWILKELEAMTWNPYFVAVILNLGRQEQMPTGLSVAYEQLVQAQFYDLVQRLDLPEYAVRLLIHGMLYVPILPGCPAVKLQFRS